jgi:DNA-binding NtrC family response regulator
MIHVLMVVTDWASAKNAQAALPSGYRVHPVSAEDAVAAMVTRSEDTDVILIDLPPEAATNLLETLVCRPYAPPVIVCGHMPDEEAIVGAIHAGAADYLSKPYSSARLRRSVDIAAVTSAARRASLPVARDGGFLGGSPHARQVMYSVAAFASDDAPVLLLGESGTGKELVARMIHRNSSRAKGRFEPINCGALPDTLFETEMFGSEKGAYTDAVSRPGLLERATGGTVFLDEIGETALHNQVKLLRAVEEKEITRVGGRQPVPVDCRLVTATNRDLRAAIADGTFRSDLYYRIAVLILLIAPLRNRKQDIPLLARDYLDTIDPTGKQFTPAAIQRLVSYPWPGNVRELRNVVHRSNLLATGDRIRASDLRFS